MSSSACFSSCAQDPLCQAASTFMNLTCLHFSQFSSIVDSDNTVTEIKNCTNEMMLSLISTNTVIHQDLDFECRLLQHGAPGWKLQWNYYGIISSGINFTRAHHVFFKVFRNCSTEQADDL